MKTLSNLSGPQLSALFAKITGGPVRRFATAKDGIRRVQAAMDDAGLTIEGAIELLNGGGVIVNPEAPAPTPRRRVVTKNGVAAPIAPEPAKAAPKAKPAPVDVSEGVTPKAVLAVIKREGGCQVGKVRAAFIASSPAFKSLAPTQQRGQVRRAIRALEADQSVTKSGAVYHVA